ncbi:MAG: PASTA domain-containing protein [Gammaproteobacteria bacterium]
MKLQKFALCRTTLFSAVSLLFALFTFTSIATPAQADVRVLAAGGVLAGNQATNTVFANGDLSGKVDRPAWVDYRLLSTADLINNYDVLVIPQNTQDWQYDIDWKTRIYPFLASGGGVVWEGYITTTTNPDGLITGQRGIRYTCANGTVCFIPNSGFGISPIAPVNVLPVTGLTDGIGPDFTITYGYFSSWDPALSPVLDINAVDLGTIVYGLQGQYGPGRIVLTQSSADYDSADTGTIQETNSYNWLVNKIRWTANSTAQPDPNVRIVPDLNGYTQADMTTAMTNTGLTPNVFVTISNLDAWGNVAATDPNPGDGASAGDTVNVFVVDTPTGAPVTTPDVRGMTTTDAAAALSAVGLQQGTTTFGSSPTVPAGSVIAQNYVPGTPNRVGWYVDLVESTGPSTTGAPAVAYLSLTDAEAAITASGNTVGNITSKGNNVVPSGYVLSQSINDTTGAVDLVVSSGPFTTALITTPDTVGQTLSAARNAVSDAGLTPLIVNTQISTTVPAGDVISQNPPAGTSLANGSSVNFVISSGPNGNSLVTTPVLEDLTQTAAETAITDNGLVVGTITFQDSTTVPAGSVISSDPVAGTLVALGSVVNLVIAGTPVTVSVPDVVGLTQTDAETAITGAGLVVGTVTTASSDTVAAGDVISQNPVAGTSVNQGSAVDLVVSTGPAATTVATPDVVGLAQADAESAITAVGLVVGTVTTSNSTTVPAGDVISQNPVAGTTVALGSAVDLVVSLGPVTVTTPDVVGLAQADAQSAIVAAGLVVGTVTTANSNTVPAGNVISQSPGAGTTVVEGSAVDLVVSLGPALITVPDVVGDTYTTAVNAITGAGLTVGNVSTVRTRRSCGIVRSQSPLGGSLVAPGSAVDLVVTRTRFCNPL